jgi:hypothetical protein
MVVENSDVEILRIDQLLLIAIDVRDAVEECALDRAKTAQGRNYNVRRLGTPLHIWNNVHRNQSDR